MGKFLKFALIAALVLAVVCGGGLFALFKFAPDDYEVSRELTISAPPAKIHAYVEDLKTWPDWSYWNLEYDPTMKWEYSGADKGVGAIQNWTGKDGPGRMEITASDPEKGVWYDMTFGPPEAQMNAKSVMEYAAAGDATNVTMSIRGSFEGPMKVMNYAADAMMGPAFEGTLQGLKEAAEASE